MLYIIALTAYIGRDIVRDMIEQVHGIDGAGNLVITESGKDINMLSDVWWYRDHKTTVDMNQSMGTKADLFALSRCYFCAYPFYR